MCLAVPMKLSDVKNQKGHAQLNGVNYEIDLSLVPQAVKGDYVIVHAGFAIELLDQEEANTRIALFADMAEANLKEEDS